MDGDIGKKETATKVVDAAGRYFDRIDLLLNNVRIYLPKPFTEYTPEDFERIIHTNVAGYFFVTQQAVAHMRKQRSGHVVSISTARNRDKPAHGDVTPEGRRCSPDPLIPQAARRSNRCGKLMLSANVCLIHQ